MSGRVIQPLDDAAIQALLQRNSWGVLSMSVDDQPYAVPIIYGYDGQQFVFANGPGRKVESLRRNPRVCLTVTEVEPGLKWKSVLVQGSVSWIVEDGEREAAFALLRAQVGMTESRRTAASVDSAPLGRLLPSEITGRSAGF